MNSRVLLSSAYLPSINWIYHFLQNEHVLIEAHEHFQKQSYRNRCEILSANGKLALSIPLIKQSDKEVISQKRISYSENWQMNHWRAITSAYKNSPYFEYFEDDFKPFYTQQYDLLFDYNNALLKLILKLWRIKKTVAFTENYSMEFNGADLRNTIHPKMNNEVIIKPYHQVFSDKHGFIANLSCIDLLFNQGMTGLDLLSVKN